MPAQGSITNTTGYVNYIYNISSRGTAQVASQLLGLSGIAGNILGQIAFQTSSYLNTTEGALLSLGVVATAGLTKATEFAMRFNQEMETVHAISGKTVSGLADDAMEMSNKFGVALSDMAQGLESLARAGVSTGNMTTILEQAMGLSKLEGLPLEKSINALISTTNLLDINNLDLESPEYAEAVKYQTQKITATSEAAPINANDIIHTLEHVGGYASSTKLDQDDLYAVIAQLGSKGTKSEMAGTSLRAFLAAGQKDTAQRALKRIGLEVKDLWKDDETIMSISDMKDVLDEAMEARGYTQQEKLEFYSDFAGYKQANQIMKIDTDSVREFKDKIDRSWDTSKKMQTVLDTAQTNLQSLMQTGINFLTKVGEPLLPIVSTIAKILKTGIDIVNAIPGSNLVIAGGLLLVSIKSISTIFNKIGPQLFSHMKFSLNIKNFWSDTKDSLKESYDIIKNISNTQILRQKEIEIEASRIDDEDKLEYYASIGYTDLQDAVDIRRLEKQLGTDNLDKIQQFKFDKLMQEIVKHEPSENKESEGNRAKNNKSHTTNKTIQAIESFSQTFSEEMHALRQGLPISSNFELDQAVTKNIEYSTKYLHSIDKIVAKIYSILYQGPPGGRGRGPTTPPDDNRGKSFYTNAPTVINTPFVSNVRDNQAHRDANKRASQERAEKRRQAEQARKDAAAKVEAEIDARIREENREKLRRRADAQKRYAEIAEPRKKVRSIIEKQQIREQERIDRERLMNDIRTNKRMKTRLSTYQSSYIKYTKNPLRMPSDVRFNVKIRRMEREARQKEEKERQQQTANTMTRIMEADRQRQQERNDRERVMGRIRHKQVITTADHNKVRNMVDIDRQRQQERSNREDLMQRIQQAPSSRARRTMNRIMDVDRQRQQERKDRAELMERIKYRQIITDVERNRFSGKVNDMVSADRQRQQEREDREELMQRIKHNQIITTPMRERVRRMVDNDKSRQRKAHLWSNKKKLMDKEYNEKRRYHIRQQRYRSNVSPEEIRQAEEKKRKRKEEIDKANKHRADLRGDHNLLSAFFDNLYDVRVTNQGHIVMSDLEAVLDTIVTPLVDTSTSEGKIIAQNFKNRFAAVVMNQLGNNTLLAGQDIPGTEAEILKLLKDENWETYFTSYLPAILRGGLDSNNMYKGTSNEEGWVHMKIPGIKSLSHFIETGYTPNATLTRARQHRLAIENKFKRKEKVQNITNGGAIEEIQRLRVDDEFTMDELKVLFYHLSDKKNNYTDNYDFASAKISGANKDELLTIVNDILEIIETQEEDEVEKQKKIDNIVGYVTERNEKLNAIPFQHELKQFKNSSNLKNYRKDVLYLLAHANEDLPNLKEVGKIVENMDKNELIASVEDAMPSRMIGTMANSQVAYLFSKMNGEQQKAFLAQYGLTTKEYKRVTKKDHEQPYGLIDLIQLYRAGALDNDVSATVENMKSIIGETAFAAYVKKNPDGKFAINSHGMLDTNVAPFALDALVHVGADGTHGKNSYMTKIARYMATLILLNNGVTSDDLSVTDVEDLDLEDVLSGKKSNLVDAARRVKKDKTYAFLDSKVSMKGGDRFRRGEIYTPKRTFAGQQIYRKLRDKKAGQMERDIEHQPPSQTRKQIEGRGSGAIGYSRGTTKKQGLKMVNGGRLLRSLQTNTNGIVDTSITLDETDWTAVGEILQRTLTYVRDVDRAVEFAKGEGKLTIEEIEERAENIRNNLSYIDGLSEKATAILNQTRRRRSKGKHEERFLQSPAYAAANRLKASQGIALGTPFSGKPDKDGKVWEGAVHHLFGWNWYPALRASLDNLIFLGDDVHNEFHDLYGRGNNTMGEFLHFLLSNHPEYLSSFMQDYIHPKGLKNVMQDMRLQIVDASQEWTAEIYRKQLNRQKTRSNFNRYALTNDQGKLLTHFDKVKSSGKVKKYAPSASMINKDKLQVLTNNLPYEAFFKEDFFTFLGQRDDGAIKSFNMRLDDPMSLAVYDYLSQTELAGYQDKDIEELKNILVSRELTEATYGMRAMPKYNYDKNQWEGYEDLTKEQILERLQTSHATGRQRVIDTIEGRVTSVRSIIEGLKRDFPKENQYLTLDEIEEDINEARDVLNNIQDEPQSNVIGAIDQNFKGNFSHVTNPALELKRIADSMNSYHTLAAASILLQGGGVLDYEMANISPLFKALGDEKYKNQVFVNKDQYIQDYGQAAFEQLKKDMQILFRIQMDPSDTFREDADPYIVKSLFTKWVTEQELNQIDPGLYDILDERETKSYLPKEYKILDYRRLQYSPQQAERMMLMHAMLDYAQLKNLDFTRSRTTQGTLNKIISSKRPLEALKAAFLFYPDLIPDLLSMMQKNFEYYNQQRNIMKIKNPDLDILVKRDQLLTSEGGPVIDTTATDENGNILGAMDDIILGDIDGNIDDNLKPQSYIENGQWKTVPDVGYAYDNGVKIPIILSALEDNLEDVINVDDIVSGTGRTNELNRLFAASLSELMKGRSNLLKATAEEIDAYAKILSQFRLYKSLLLEISTIRLQRLFDLQQYHKDMQSIGADAPSADLMADIFKNYAPVMNVLGEQTLPFEKGFLDDVLTSSNGVVQFLKAQGALNDVLTSPDNIVALLQSMGYIDQKTVDQKIKGKSKTKQISMMKRKSRDYVIRNKSREPLYLDKMRKEIREGTLRFDGYDMTYGSKGPIYTKNFRDQKRYKEAVLILQTNEMKRQLLAGERTDKWSQRFWEKLSLKGLTSKEIREGLHSVTFDGLVQQHFGIGTNISSAQRLDEIEGWEKIVDPLIKFVDNEYDQSLTSYRVLPDGTFGSVAQYGDIIAAHNVQTMIDEQKKREKERIERNKLMERIKAGEVKTGPEREREKRERQRQEMEKKQELIQQLSNTKVSYLKRREIYSNIQKEYPNIFNDFIQHKVALLQELPDIITAPDLEPIVEDFIQTFSILTGLESEGQKDTTSALMSLSVRAIAFNMDKMAVDYPDDQEGWFAEVFFHEVAHAIASHVSRDKETTRTKIPRLGIDDKKHPYNAHVAEIEANEVAGLLMNIFGFNTERIRKKIIEQRKEGAKAGTIGRVREDMINAVAESMQNNLPFFIRMAHRDMNMVDVDEEFKNSVNAAFAQMVANWEKYGFKPSNTAQKLQWIKENGEIIETDDSPIAMQSDIIETDDRPLATQSDIAKGGQISIVGLRHQDMWKKNSQVPKIGEHAYFKVEDGVVKAYLNGTDQVIGVLPQSLDKINELNKIGAPTEFTNRKMRNTSLMNKTATITNVIPGEYAFLSIDEDSPWKSDIAAKEHVKSMVNAHAQHNQEHINRQKLMEKIKERTRQSLSPWRLDDTAKEHIRATIEQQNQHSQAYIDRQKMMDDIASGIISPSGRNKRKPDVSPQNDLPPSNDVIPKWRIERRARMKNVVDNYATNITDFIAGKAPMGNMQGVYDLDKVVDALDDHGQKIQGLGLFLEDLNTVLPVLTPAILAIQTILTAKETAQKGIGYMQSFMELSGKIQGLGENETYGLPWHTKDGEGITADSNMGKLLIAASDSFSAAFAAIEAAMVPLIPYIIAIAGAVVLVTKALEWSYQSHQKYLKTLEEEQKENRSRSKALKASAEDARNLARRNRAPRQQAALDRNARLAQQRLDNANMTRQFGAMELSRARNDTLWGSYGISAGISKILGQYESTAEDYDGTSKETRKIKEATLANPFASDAMRQVSAYYDANQLGFAQMDEYKEELGELYDTETGIMKKVGPDVDARSTPQFQRALDKFVEATGITRDHAQQYLDYMQTEHNVDKATQAMQAQSDTIAAQTEMKIQAISFGGNPADVLGLNGIEAQQNAMVKAQADMIKMELTGQLWWKAVWATITAPVKLIISPIFAIANLLGAIWAFMTGNWSEAWDKAGKATSSFNVFGEAATYWSAWGEAESTDFNAIGQSAVDDRNRRNYGNAPATSSGVGYHNTPQVPIGHYGWGGQKFIRDKGNQSGSEWGHPPRNQGSGGLVSGILGNIAGMLGTIITILTTGLLLGGIFKGVTKLGGGGLKDSAIGSLQRFLFADDKIGMLKSGIPSKDNIMGSLQRFLFADKKEMLKDKIPDKDSAIGSLQRLLFSDSGLTDKYGDNAWVQYGQKKIKAAKQLPSKFKEQYIAPWKEYIGNRMGLSEDYTINDYLSDKKASISEKYIAPWKEHLQQRKEDLQGSAKKKIKNWHSSQMAQAEWYRNDPEAFDASFTTKAYAKMLDFRDKHFGGVDSIQELFQDPEKMEAWARDKIKNADKDSFVGQTRDKLLNAGEMLKDPEATMEFLSGKKELVKDKIGGLRGKLAHRLYGEDATLTNEEIFGGLWQLGQKNAEDGQPGYQKLIEQITGKPYGVPKVSTVEMEKWKEWKENPIRQNWHSAKDKVSEMFEPSDDEEGGFNLKDKFKSLKDKVSGLFGDDEDEEKGFSIKDKFKSLKDKIVNLFGGDDGDEGGSGGLLDTAKNFLGGIFKRDKDDIKEEAKAKVEAEEESEPASIRDIFKQMHDLDKDEVKNEFKANKAAAKDVLTGKAFDVENLQNSMLLPNGMSYSESDPGAFDEDVSILDLAEGSEEILSKDNIKTGSKMVSKAGKWLSGKSGKAGKVGKFLTNIGSKVGSLGEGGGFLSSLLGGGEAAAGVAGAAEGGGILASLGGALGIGGAAAEGGILAGVLGGGAAAGGVAAAEGGALLAAEGGLAATGVGLPLALALAAGTFLLPGILDGAGKVLGGIGDAIFGKKGYNNTGRGGSILGGLTPAPILGALGGAIGLGGMVAGGIGGMLGGILGMGKGVKGGGMLKNTGAGVFGIIAGAVTAISGKHDKNLELSEKQNKAMNKVADKVGSHSNSNATGGNITIQNININTDDDPEAIKAMFLDLIVELQEQVNPRLVSRTTGSANTSTSDSSSQTESEQSQQQQSGSGTSNSGGQGLGGH